MIADCVDLVTYIRFAVVAKEDKLWETLCKKRWGQLEDKNIFSRDNKVNWMITFKNNYHNERSKAKQLAAIRNPLPCIYCGNQTATLESRQRNVQYVQWHECISCGKCWGWSVASGTFLPLETKQLCRELTFDFTRRSAELARVSETRQFIKKLQEFTQHSPLSVHSTS